MSNPIERRGFLAFLGFGAVSGPKLVEDGIKHALNPPKMPSTIGQALNAASRSFTGENSSVESVRTQPSKLYSLFRRRVIDEGRINFLRKYGLSPNDRSECWAKARQLVYKEGMLPAHIQSLKSFSLVRKQQLATDYFYEEMCKGAIRREILISQRDAYGAKRRRYIDRLTARFDKAHLKTYNEEDTADDSEDQESY